mmetsp:Transcript_49875/g.125359  ORF Transcript_49875/g.125359 Transcript_49875/m.125359 type:complete len:408 (+) Transcript_49875:1-1224(+)
MEATGRQDAPQESVLGEMLVRHVNGIATEVYRLLADPSFSPSPRSATPTAEVASASTRKPLDQDQPDHPSLGNAASTVIVNSSQNPATAALSVAAPSSEASQSETLPVLVLIPGNPGVVGFYRYYADGLWRALGGRYTILCVGHAGHMANHSRYHPEGPVYDLEQQIEHKCVFLRDHVAALLRATEQEELSRSSGTATTAATSGSRAPVVLMGHSIGGYICLHSMRRLAGEVEVQRCVLLMATLQHLGKGLAPSVKRLVRPGFMQSMGAMLHYSPNFLKRFLISFHKELDVEDKELLLSGLLSWEVSQNVLYMARIEADTIHELDHLLVEEHIERCYYLFADGDQYTPGHAVYMQRHWPSGKIEEHTGIPHAFVTCRKSTDRVIEFVSRDLQKNIMENLGRLPTLDR